VTLLAWRKAQGYIPGQSFWTEEHHALGVGKLAGYQRGRRKIPVMPEPVVKGKKLSQATVESRKRVDERG